MDWVLLKDINKIYENTTYAQGKVGLLILDPTSLYIMQTLKATTSLTGSYLDL